MSSRDRGRWATALRLIGIGWFVAITILLGVVGGSWLDRRFATGPLLVIAGLLLGLGTAFYGVYRVLRSILRNQ